MPFTFSAASFSFLKSSTISQPFNPLNIEQQNNHVDNVNKNINHNDKHNDNVDIDNNSMAYSPPLENNTKVIPLERRVRSLEVSTSFKSNRHNSNASNSPSKNFIRKPTWYKSIFARIHHTMLRWNDDDGNVNKNIGPDKVDNHTNNVNTNDTVENNDNNNNNTDVESTNGQVVDEDDDGIIMKSRNVVETQAAAFTLNHGFCNMQHPPLLSSSPNDTTSSNPTTFPTTISDKRVKQKRHSTSSVFEKCAQTPRHFTKETEVLGKVGRFTIVRESEDFDTTYFDQCHCHQKPCRFSISDCGGTHPTLEPDSFSPSHPISIPIRQNSLKCVGVNDGASSRSSVSSSVSSQHLTSQEIAAIAHQQIQMNHSSNNQNSWPSITPSKSRRSFYCSSSSTSSRHSLPLMQKYNGVINVNNNTNGVWPIPMMVSKVASAAASSSSISCRGVLLQSASSPNLVHLHQRENLSHHKTASSKTSNNNGRPMLGGRHSNPNPQGYKGSYNYPQCPSPVNNNNTLSRSSSSPLTVKAKKPSLVNMKATDHEQRRKLSMPPTFTAPTSPTKFSFSHPHNNEPHTTINSHSGRKFEVEWTSSTAKSTSTTSTSSTSSTSSETASSPPSTISSTFSAASSPGTSVNSTGTLSRQCSTLSSKCGRKFEVTVLSSIISSGNGLTNTSPHNTIDSNTDSTKC